MKKQASGARGIPDAMKQLVFDRFMQNNHKRIKAVVTAKLGRVRIKG